jgi:lipoate synthase
MNIKHAVLTSVDRDDLKDMGAHLEKKRVAAVRPYEPTTLEYYQISKEYQKH